MKESKIPTHYPVTADGISFVDINNKFKTSKYGETLEANSRFWTFKPKGTSALEWEKLLGADVNNLHHLQVSLGITRSFLAVCETPRYSWRGSVPPEATFSPQEQSTLQLTAIVHDWGEAIIGDIPMPNKTKADESREMVALRGIVYDVLGDKRDKDFCDKASDNVIEVLTDRTSKLGKAFNAIEHAGYARTGLRAWEKSKKVDGDIKDVLEELGHRVVTHAISRLVPYAEVYPAIDSYLAYNTKKIDQVFEEAKSYDRYSSKNLKEGKRLWEMRKRDSL